MGMPLSMGIWQMHMEQQPTWIAPMDACATALTTGLAPIATSLQRAKLPLTAVAMVKPMTRTTPMVAHAIAPTILKVLIVDGRRLALKRFVLDTELQATLMPRMAASAPAREVMVE